jgi:hypothetical protein
MTAPRRGARPWTPVEAGLLLTLAYVLLLISLAASRLARIDVPARPAASAAAATDLTVLDLRARLVAETRTAPDATTPTATPGPAPALPPPAARAAVPPPDPVGVPAPAAAAPGLVPTCVGPRTAPRSYAGGPGVEAPFAFGPPVEPGGPRMVETVNGTLIQRLCGGIADAGQAARPPDRRLFVALDAVVNGRDPNRVISRAAWAAGVDDFITRQAQWTRARIVTRDAPVGTRTYAMRIRPGADPLVEPTRLLAPTRSRYLVLPVHRAAGGETVLMLRLACGFQPTFPPA